MNRSEGERDVAAGSRMRRRRTCGPTCGAGCGAVVFAAVVGVVLLYAATGRYQPKLPPQPPPPFPNGYTDYLAAASLLARNGGTAGMYNLSGMPVVSREATVVARNQAALSRLRIACGKACRVPPWPGFMARWQTFAPLRDLGRLVMAEAEVRAARGDYGGAVSAWLDGVEMGQDLERGGELIDGMLGLAIQQMGMRRIPDWIDRLSASDCERLSDRLQAVIRNHVLFADIVAQEHYAQLDTIAHPGPRGIPRFFNPSAPGGAPPPGAAEIGGFAWHFLRDRALRDLDDYYRALERELRKPRAARKPVRVPTSIFASVLAPTLGQSDKPFVETDARERLILVALRIRAYRLERGTLPPNLAALGVPPDVTADPYTGQPLIYRPNVPAPGNYLLYSVGPNLRDDGGMPVDESGRSGPPDGDIGLRPYRSRPRGAQAGYQPVPHMLPVTGRSAGRPMNDRRAVRGRVSGTEERQSP